MAMTKNARVNMKLIICILGLTVMTLAEHRDNQKNLQALLKHSNDKFTAQMFHEVAAAEKNAGQNVILSAFSVLPPLAQLALASVGESHDELLNTISLPNDTVVQAVFLNLKKELLKVKGVDLHMANRIYLTHEEKLNINFAVISKKVFNSTVSNVNFGKNETINEINAWVESQTNHRIKDFLDNNVVNEATKIILVNAIYFKGTWKHKFNKFLTANKDFHLSSGETVKVPTMAIDSKLFKYSESTELDAKLFILPYNGPDTSFLVVLPNEVDGISKLQEKLKDASVLNKAVSNMTLTTIDVEMPKFKIQTETNLKQTLQHMNVTKLFSPSESKLYNLLEYGSVHLSGAIQKAFIEVNEEGAEAAAANEFHGFTSVLSKTIKVDKPFYFEVLYKSTPLFNGVVVNPLR